MAPELSNPVIEEHDGVLVVRDDLIAGGTKARYLARLFDEHDEVVYASPAYGGAQLALAYCARAAGKRATIFVAKRAKPHARTLEARAAGARVFQVPHGYLSNVQAKAKLYARDTGAHLLAFGGESEAALDAIADAARVVFKQAAPIDEVWCASGSGVLVRGLQRASDLMVRDRLSFIGRPPLRFIAVQVGHQLSPEHVGGAEIIVHPMAFEKELAREAPFPSCPNYDRKAWELCTARKRGRALFWNVLGPSPTSASK